MTMSCPITMMTVLSQVPDQNAVFAAFQDGQSFPIPVPVMSYGPADALRVRQAPLPGRGTAGVVAFMNGDVRNPIWLGSFTPWLADALGSSGDPFLAYESHFSGYWQSVDGSGNATLRFPDNTMVVVGKQFSPGLHIQNADSGAREFVARTPSNYPPVAAGFPVEIEHSSGASVVISASGAITATAATGQTLTLISNGATALIDANGNMTFTGVSEIHAKAPAIYLDDGGTTQPICLQAFATWAESHEHSGVMTGGGDTGPPTSSPPASALTSVVQAQ